MSEPSSERRQHNRITRDDRQLADAAGLIGNPWRVEGLLARLERHGNISRRQRAAGDQFAVLFQLAHLDPLRAGDMGQRIVVQTRAGAHSSERARRRVVEALDALGGISGELGCCAWYVIGCEMPLAEWIRRQEWAGKPVGPQVAKGLLIGTLTVLARHFRL
jgi:hypothetical protein